MRLALIGAGSAAAAWVCAGLAIRGVRRSRAGNLLFAHERRSPRRRLRVDRHLVVAGAAITLVAAIVGPGAAIVAMLAMGIGRLVRRRAAARVVADRRDEQVADLAGVLAAAMRAGMSVQQALGYAAREAEEPLRIELERVVEDLEVGVELGQAIDAWTRRVGTEDARLLMTAVDLHRSIGGDLPAVLDQVSASVRDRLGAAREVLALTAQARLSGVVLGLLPIGFLAFLWITSRRDIEGVVRTRAGVAAVLSGLALDAVGFLWIRRLVDVG
jgi:tight adherence protein B